MRRKFSRTIFTAILCALSLFIVIFVPLYGATNSVAAAEEKENNLTVLNVWQIDNFEGGKGSRAAYLQKLGNEFAKNNYCYVVVTSLSAEAAMINAETGNVPQLISYGAGVSGINGLIKSEETVWCHGGYCILTTDDSADFSDINDTNTVINGGTGNFSRAAALFCGLGGASVQKPTEAYVNLINKKFKYLLGTQRDIYRLKTRGESFKIKPVEQFNDLYQNIAVTTTDKKEAEFAKKYVDFIISKSENVKNLGLMVENKRIHDDEASALEGVNYLNTLRGAITEDKRNEILQAIENHDENKLKILLN